MRHCLMGMETEYALMALRCAGPPPSAADLSDALIDVAEEKLVHLHGAGLSDLYLANGGRLYIDCGHHPEFSTPECTSPWETVRYVKAGDRIMRSLVERLEVLLPEMDEVLVTRGNVDYSGTGSTWGCHESYLHRCSRQELAGQLVPHLVSRVVFAGAGGFDSRSPGLSFTLSARAPHIVRTASKSSTAVRGIFHIKDEPLCEEGYGRLHVICGDSLLSETSMTLALGTTALLVRLVDAGVRPGDAVQLRAPVRALQRIARDPTCRVSVPLERGPGVSAIEIQQHLLSQVEARVDRDYMPEWAPALCQLWREVLDRLERDPGQLEGTLDWAIKLALYREHVKQSGILWEQFGRCTAILSMIRRLMALVRVEDGRVIDVDRLLSRDSPLKASVPKLTQRLEDNGLSWDDLRAFVRLRSRLCEIDMRFGELGAAGIFGALDRDGVLTHARPEVRGIEEAMKEPPAVGRARLRGQVIQRLAGVDHGSYQCAWYGIREPVQNRYLDLSSPFEAKERWVERSKAPRAGRHNLCAHARIFDDGVP